VARARVIGADGAATAVASGPVSVNTVVSPGTAGTLVLAEAAGGWSATLNGRPLAQVAQPVDGWAQGFVLPAGGGHLVITRDELARDLSLGAEAAAVLVVFALALPGTRSAVPAPAAGTEAGSETTPVPGRRRDQARERAHRDQAGEPARRDQAGDPAHRDQAGEPAAPGLRGGQHAARHGKPSWRRRGPATRPAPGPPGGGAAPALPDLDPFLGDEETGVSPWVTADPMTAGSPAPQESGDRP
jgi:hypothetical protein